MKLITDLRYRSNTIVLENFIPHPDEAMSLYNFCQEAYGVPEVIGGIYFNDCDNKQHWVELKNQSLYTLVFVLKSMALRLPLSIVYDDNEAPLYLFKLPGWFIRFLQFIGYLKHPMTYADFVKHADPHPSRAVSSEIHQQP